MAGNLGFHTELDITSILWYMMSYGSPSGGISVGFSSGESSGNSATGSYIIRVDNALVTIGSGPTSLEGSMLS